MMFGMNITFNSKTLKLQQKLPAVLRDKKRTPPLIGYCLGPSVHWTPLRYGHISKVHYTLDLIRYGHVSRALMH